MEIFPLVVGFSLAIGVGMLAHAVLAIVYETGRRLTRPARRGRLHALGLSQSQTDEKRSEEAILGYGHIPWANLYAISALAGLVLLAVIGPYLPSLRLGFLALPGLVWLARRTLLQQRRRFMASQVRQFLIDTRLHMSLQGSLLLGLNSLAKTTLDTSAVYRRLQKRLQGSSARSGLDLLVQLAEDLGSPQLRRAAQRVEAAQQSGGVTDVDDALSGVIQELEEEIGYQSEEQMQRLPLRITLLSMPFLLGPIVILLFYPLVDRILQTLSGVSIGGGF